uniref:Ig-like domain-containing protein n=1 Tax=Erpetoichthys calabaricus TaxID=27687 RepID=A0A8C4SAT2_ERPCA
IFSSVYSLSLFIISLLGLKTGSGYSVSKQNRFLQTEIIGSESTAVTINCSYSTNYISVYLFWYRKYPNRSMQYILSKGARSASGYENAADFYKERFSSRAGQDFTELTISGLTLSDSAIYYCALSLTALLSPHALNKNQ